MKLSDILLENPEVIDGRFQRYDYDVYVFMGDSKGVIITDKFRSHGELLLSLSKAGAINDDDGNYELVADRIPFDVLGKPQEVLFPMSGVVLPKQGDVDGTYVSFWTNSAARYLKELLKPFIRQFEGPYYVEVNDSDSITSKSFTTSVVEGSGDPGHDVPVCFMVEIVYENVRRRYSVDATAKHKKEWAEHRAMASFLNSMHMPVESENFYLLKRLGKITSSIIPYPDPETRHIKLKSYE